MKKSLIIILSLLIFIIIFSKCINSASGSSDLRGKLYAGAATCRQCHQAIYDSVVTTAHFNSTAEAGKNSIHGNFDAGQNQLQYADGSIIKMEARDSGFYQVAYQEGKEIAAHRIDIVFGGKNAQTFASFANNQVYELPVSHYTAFNTWGTSPGPGFSAKAPYFRRSIGQGCFDCHSSAMETDVSMSPGKSTETFRSGTLLYGIDCERCHGPAQNHVNYQLAHPEEKAAKYMIRNLSLSRQQRVDACAVCHAGNDREKLLSRFNFKMGDTLENIFMPFGEKPNTAEFDVHGNQFRLLEQSRCYRNSTTITCNTCHSAHGDAGKDLAIYSQKCMSCHSEANHNFCPKAASLGESIKSNCIDCHMPKQPSKAITFELADGISKSAYMLRNHRIAIYDSTKPTINRKQ